MWFLLLCGIDVLQRNDFDALQGKKVGLITNHTGRTIAGEQTVDVIFKAKGVQLKAIFSPEHGLRGAVDESVDDTKDTVTGLPVYSLYNLKEKGEARYKPDKEQLKGLDVLVFDIQDVGARFYTYTGTMGYCMEAAAEMGIKFIVLDRPNPIGGLRVAGPVSEPGFKGLTAYFPMPTQHGMTAGELAQMYKGELKLKLDLQVIWCDTWTRNQYWDQTGLVWTNPSPNMRSVTQAMLYPGICYVEATNISVGRGTDTPFEVVGAPYIDGRELANELNAAQMPGVSFYPIEFTPKDSKFKGEKCKGVSIIVTDRSKLDAVQVGMRLAALLKEYKEWESDKLVRLVHNQKAVNTLFDKGYDAARSEWLPDLAKFMTMRKKYLHYK